MQPSWWLILCALLRGFLTRPMTPHGFPRAALSQCCRLSPCCFSCWGVVERKKELTGGVTRSSGQTGLSPSIQVDIIAIGTSIASQQPGTGDSMSDANQDLFLGREVRLVLRRVECTVLRAGAVARAVTGARGTAAAVAVLTARGHVLGIGARAVALASRTGTARATGAFDRVLGGGVVAVALESRLLAARASGLLGTDALSALAAAGGGLGRHCCSCCGCCFWTVVGKARVGTRQTTFGKWKD